MVITGLLAAAPGVNLPDAGSARPPAANSGPDIQSPYSPYHQGAEPTPAGLSGAGGIWDEINSQVNSIEQAAAQLGHAVMNKPSPEGMSNIATFAADPAATVNIGWLGEYNLHLRTLLASTPKVPARKPLGRLPAAPPSVPLVTPLRTCPRCPTSAEGAASVVAVPWRAISTGPALGRAFRCQVVRRRARSTRTRRAAVRAPLRPRADSRRPVARPRARAPWVAWVAWASRVGAGRYRTEAARLHQGRAGVPGARRGPAARRDRRAAGGAESR